MSKLESTIGKLAEEAQRIKDGLKAEIAALPDNPKIKRLSDSPSCYSVKAGDLGNNFSAEYHDFKWQYERIIEIIDKTDTLNLPTVLAGLVMGARYKKDQRIITFHPEVIRRLTEII